MTTFYRDDVVYVGSAELQVDKRAYKLDDLVLVWHRRGPRGAKGVAIIFARTVLIVVVLAAIALGGTVMRRAAMNAHGDRIMVIAGGVVAVVLLGTIGLFVVEGMITLIERSYERGGKEHQIWARHFDEDVLIFATRDKLRFGKVYRALQRAIEHREL
jgi:hypothetical protein